MKKILNHSGSALVSILSATAVMGIVSVATMQMIKNAKNAESYINKMTDFANFTFNARLVLENQPNCTDMAANLDFLRDDSKAKVSVTRLRYAVGSAAGAQTLVSTNDYIYEKVKITDMHIEGFQAIDSGFKTYKADLVFDAVDEGRNNKPLMTRIPLKIATVLKDPLNLNSANPTIDVKSMKIVSCVSATSADVGSVTPTCPAGTVLLESPLGPSCEEDSAASTPTSTTVPAAPAACNDPLPASTGQNVDTSWDFTYLYNGKVDGVSSSENPYTGHNACARIMATCLRVYDRNGIQRACDLNLSSSYTGSTCSATTGCAGIALCRKYSASTMIKTTWDFTYLYNGKVDGVAATENPYTGNNACALKKAACHKVYDSKGIERACNLNLSSSYTGSTCADPTGCAGTALCRKYSNSVATTTWDFHYLYNGKVDGSTGTNPYTGNAACASKTADCFKVYDKKGIERACDLNLSSSYTGSTCADPTGCGGVALCANCAGSFTPTEQGTSWSNKHLTGDGACHALGGTCKSASGSTQSGYSESGCNRALFNGGALCNTPSGGVGAQWAGKHNTGDGACYGIGGTCLAASGATQSGYAESGCNRAVYNGGARCSLVAGDSGASWSNKNLTGDGACFALGKTCKSASGGTQTGYAESGCNRTLFNGGALCD